MDTNKLNCPKCNKEGLLFSTFGNIICTECGFCMPFSSIEEFYNRAKSSKRRDCENLERSNQEPIDKTE